MRHTTIAATLVAALFATATDSPARAQQPGVAVTHAETLTATVVSLKLGSREVVLRDQGGQLLTVVAGPEARNLAQFRPGDRVAIEYREALAVEMVRPDDPRPSAEVLAGGERAPEGARPGGDLAQMI